MFPNPYIIAKKSHFGQGERLPIPNIDFEIIHIGKWLLVEIIAMLPLLFFMAIRFQLRIGSNTRYVYVCYP